VIAAVSRYRRDIGPSTSEKLAASRRVSALMQAGEITIPPRRGAAFFCPRGVAGQET
jgi:hypothetical protein